MAIVTVSPEYELVIPREVSGSLGIEPGQELLAFAYEGRLELVPLCAPRSLRGFAQGIDTSVARSREP